MAASSAAQAGTGGTSRAGGDRPRVAHPEFVGPAKRIQPVVSHAWASRCGFLRNYLKCLSLFDKWRGLTDGALDASAETITRVWKRAAAENRIPSQAELDAAVASVRRVHWKLDAVNRTATHTSDAPLAMNSFVKSYIAGHAADAALSASGAQRNGGKYRRGPGGAGRLERAGGRRRSEIGRGKWGAHRAPDGSRSRRGDQRRLPARRGDRRAALFAHRRSANRNAGRGNHQLDGDRAGSGRGRRAGHGVFRADAGGKRAPGRLRCRAWNIFW